MNEGINGRHSFVKLVNLWWFFRHSCCRTVDIDSWSEQTSIGALGPNVHLVRLQFFTYEGNKTQSKRSTYFKLSVFPIFRMRTTGFGTATIDRNSQGTATRLSLLMLQNPYKCPSHLTFPPV